MRALSVLVFCSGLTVSACGSTEAQVEVTNVQKDVLTSISEYKTCQTALASSPNYSSLAQRFPLDNSDPTLEELSDNTLPTADQIQQVLDWHKGIATCRLNLIVASQGSFPFMTEALNSSWAATDATLVPLVQDRVTWGATNQQLVEVNRQSRGRVQTALEEFEQREGERNQAELAHRAAIWGASLVEWLPLLTPMLRHNRRVAPSLERMPLAHTGDR